MLIARCRALALDDVTKGGEKSSPFSFRGTNDPV